MPPCCVLTATCLCNIYKGAAAVALLPITVYVLDAGENPLGAADPTSRAVRVSLVLGNNNKDNASGGPTPVRSVTRVIAVPSQSMPAAVQVPGGGAPGGIPAINLQK